MCYMHNRRVTVHGDPNYVPAGTQFGEAQRFLNAAILSDTDDCILWPFAKNMNGYGAITVDGKTQRPHRIVCQEVHGPGPYKHEVAHNCGNRLCINPRHLRWATREDNQADRAIHGTSNRGERQWANKLKPEQVVQIRKLLTSGATTQREIARMYGISRESVSGIKRGLTWGWL